MKYTIIVLLAILTTSFVQVPISIKTSIPSRVGVTFTSIAKDYETNRPFAKVAERISNLQLNELRSVFGKIKPSGYYDEKEKAFFSSYGERIDVSSEIQDGDTIRIVGFTHPVRDSFQKTLDFQVFKKEDLTVVRLINANMDVKPNFFDVHNEDSKLLERPESGKYVYCPNSVVLESGQSQYSEWEQQAISNFENVVWKNIK